MNTTDTPTSEHPKGGAPSGNRNRLTHGVRSYLALGRLPRGASYIRRLLNGLRQQLEAALIDRHGELSVYQAALVQSACRHEGRAQLLTRYLRQGDEKTTTAATTTGKDGSTATKTTKTSSDGLTLQERLALLKEIGAATDSRDKCLERLGLDKADELDFFDRYYASGPQAMDDPHSE